MTTTSYDEGLLGDNNSNKEQQLQLVHEEHRLSEHIHILTDSLESFSNYYNNATATSTSTSCHKEGDGTPARGSCTANNKNTSGTSYIISTLSEGLYFLLKAGFAMSSVFIMTASCNLSSLSTSAIAPQRHRATSPCCNASEAEFLLNLCLLEESERTKRTERKDNACDSGHSSSSHLCSCSSCFVQCEALKWLHSDYNECCVNWAHIFYEKVILTSTTTTCTSINASSIAEQVWSLALEKMENEFVHTFTREALLLFGTTNTHLLKGERNNKSEDLKSMKGLNVSLLLRQRKMKELSYAIWCPFFRVLELCVWVKGMGSACEVLRQSLLQFPDGLAESATKDKKVTARKSKESFANSTKTTAQHKEKESSKSLVEENADILSGEWERECLEELSSRRRFRHRRTTHADEKESSCTSNSDTCALWNQFLFFGGNNNNTNNHSRKKTPVIEGESTGVKEGSTLEIALRDLRSLYSDHNITHISMVENTTTGSRNMEKEVNYDAHHSSKEKKTAGNEKSTGETMTITSTVYRWLQEVAKPFQELWLRDLCVAVNRSSACSNNNNNNNGTGFSFISVPFAFFSHVFFDQLLHLFVAQLCSEELVTQSPFVGLISYNHCVATGRSFLKSLFLPLTSPEVRSRSLHETKENVNTKEEKKQEDSPTEDTSEIVEDKLPETCRIFANQFIERSSRIGTDFLDAAVSAFSEELHCLSLACVRHAAPHATYTSSSSASAGTSPSLYINRFHAFTRLWANSTPLRVLLEVYFPCVVDPSLEPFAEGLLSVQQQQQRQQQRQQEGETIAATCTNTTTHTTGACGVARVVCETVKKELWMKVLIECGEENKEEDLCEKEGKEEGRAADGKMPVMPMLTTIEQLLLQF